MPLIHDWRPIDGGGYRCSGCGARSVLGTSRGECRPVSVRAESTRTRIETPKYRGRGQCRHRGEQATKDGEPWFHRCGCPSSEEIPVQTCAVHGFCILTAIAAPNGVKECRRCKDFEPTDENQ